VNVHKLGNQLIKCCSILVNVISVVRAQQYRKPPAFIKTRDSEPRLLVAGVYSRPGVYQNTGSGSINC